MPAKSTNDRPLLTILVLVLLTALPAAAQILPVDPWPESVVFGNWTVGDEITLWVGLHNSYVNTDPAALDIVLVPAGAPFRIVSGGGPTVIQPGNVHGVQVAFEPTVAGDFSAALELGGGLAALPVSGLAADSFPACIESSPRVVFPATPSGGTTSRPVTVRNVGSSPFTLDAVAEGGPFGVVSDPVTLQPGQTGQVMVRYSPYRGGFHYGLLHLGTDACRTVMLEGQMSSGIGAGQDGVSIFFDPGYYSRTASVNLGQVIDAYVVLENVSAPAGITGWELMLGTGTAATIVGASFPAAAVNFSAPPEYTVSFGVPRPMEQNVLLATVQLLGTAPATAAPLTLAPTYRPSVPGSLAYSYAPDHELVACGTWNGAPEVAWIDVVQVVAVQAPTPTAVLSGGRVELRWPLPSDGADGCHVYRAVGGDETRLTASPLQPSGSGYVFVDDAAGLAAGATAAYSYAVLRGGVEIARSPAVAIELPGTAALATRLLPNRPNPFNPETELRFTLERAGAVRLAVFDVAGRRVAVLADGHREQGAHQVTWRGRDDAGRALPSGAYYVRLETARGAETQKVMLLK